jgi:serine/threonine-protein kinase
MVDAPVRPGDILARKYRVDRVLGAGNMGVVVAATHVELGQRVALKFMIPGKEGGREQRERFLREARATVRLRSQHVAKVLDVGVLENEAPYIVLELLEGSDLAAQLQARGQLPFAEAVEYVLQASEAVAEAHAAGIVHRDLKPANLFLTTDVGGLPCVKVLDFGISKFTDSAMTLTQEAQALGSPLYMSPEQMNSSKDVDPRSDVWALGTILYQLVAGRTPYHADSVQQLCARVLFGQPTPLAQFRPDAPPGFEAVIARCIERDRERRVRDVATLAAAIAPYAPARAHAYVERVSRALGVAPSYVAPVVEPAAPAAPVSASASRGPGTGQTGGAMMATQHTAVMMSPFAAPSASWGSAAAVSSGQGPAAPAASSPGPSSAGPSSVGAPPVMAASAPVVGGDTGLALSASQLAVHPAAAPTRAKGSGWIPVLVGLAVLVVAVPALVLATLRFAGPAPVAGAVGAVPVAPVVSASASAAPPEAVATVAPGVSASASVAPSATAPGTASGSAAEAPAAAAPARLPGKMPGKAAPRPAAKGAPAVSYDERQ